MPENLLPNTGRGLSWVLDYGRELITKTLAPSFVFVDLETYVNTNACHRLDKRNIRSYVSVNAPTLLLASLYGHSRAVEMLCTDADNAAVKRARDYVCSAMESACDAGADALIICDDLIGEDCPAVSQENVSESIVPLYKVFCDKADELELPLIFHSPGDIRDFYPALAEEGFSGVHVCHPDPSLVSAMFGSARASGLRPIGGLIGSMVGEGPEALAEFASSLESGGSALICDDGTVRDFESLKTVTKALSLMP